MDGKKKKKSLADGQRSDHGGIGCEAIDDGSIAEAGHFHGNMLRYDVLQESWVCIGK